uniref:Uncharacterized protein n=1 Tax=Plectus sambesii TaxID=2011161 RepID=A0A914V7E1_9BILA
MRGRERAGGAQTEVVMGDWNNAAVKQVARSRPTRMPTAVDANEGRLRKLPASHSGRRSILDEAAAQRKLARISPVLARRPSAHVSNPIEATNLYDRRQPRSRLHHCHRLLATVVRIGHSAPSFAPKDYWSDRVSDHRVYLHEQSLSCLRSICQHCSVFDSD